MTDKTLTCVSTHIPFTNRQDTQRFIDLLSREPNYGNRIITKCAESIIGPDTVAELSAVVTKPVDLCEPISQTMFSDFSIVVYKIKEALDIKSIQKAIDFYLSQIGKPRVYSIIHPKRFRQRFVINDIVPDDEVFTDRTPEDDYKWRQKFLEHIISYLPSNFTYENELYMHVPMCTLIVSVWNLSPLHTLTLHQFIQKHIELSLKKRVTRQCAFIVQSLTDWKIFQLNFEDSFLYTDNTDNTDNTNNSQTLILLGNVVL